MSAKKDGQDDEPTAAFVIPEALLRRARGEEPSPDTERQPGSSKAHADDIPTAPHARPVRPSEPARPHARPLVEPPRLRRPSYRPAEPPPSAPPTERPADEDTLVNMSREELLRRR